MKIRAAALLTAACCCCLSIASGSAAAQTRTLDTIRVAARSPDPALATMRSTEVIGRDELAKRAGHDLADILSTSLGLDVFRRSPAQADVAIRGSSFNQIVVLVDGVRVSDAQSGHYNLDLAVPIESIERIEILRGGGSTLFGADAIGGVVNIVTRRNAAPARIGLHAGTFGTAGADLGLSGSAGATSLMLTSDFRRSDGHRDGTDYRASQARLSASRPIAGGRLSVDGGLGVRNFGAADFYGAFPSFEDTRTTTASAHYDRPLSPTWSIDASADVRRHYDLYTLIRTNPATYQNRHTSWQRGGRAVASGRVGGARVAIGGEGLDLDLKSARLGDREEQRAAGFAELGVGSRARVMGLVGSRLDWSSRTGSFFSPGASLSAAVTRAVQVRASANRGYRAPTWTEAYYSDPANEANPDLRSETFDMGELGVRATPSWGSVDVAAFIRKGKELIDWTKPVATPTALWRSTNLEAATFRGVELETSIADLLGVEWRVRASGLRVSSADADTLVGKYALSPLSETASLEATTPDLLGFRLTANSGRYRRLREPHYWRTDLRVTRSMGLWSLRLDGLNLTNAEYRDAAAKTAAGRILLIGVERVCLAGSC